MIGPALVLAAALDQAPSPAPYAGQEAPAIKALSAEEVAAYLEGEGRGLARAAELDRAVDAIAALHGRLRAAHLRAHLATRAALIPEQAARYDGLRGYAHGAGAHHGHR